MNSLSTSPRKKASAPRSSTRITQYEIGALPLQPGQSLALLYDFGDSWRFDVKLERIDPPNRRQKKLKILESHGKAPEQYPSWDE